MSKNRSRQSERRATGQSRTSRSGARGIRTPDILLAKQALYQLSYGPDKRDCSRRAGDAVGLGGVEPPTSRLSGVRSNHLSYSPASRSGERRLDGRSEESGPATVAKNSCTVRTPEQRAAKVPAHTCVILEALSNTLSGF